MAASADPAGIRFIMRRIGAPPTFIMLNSTAPLTPLQPPLIDTHPAPRVLPRSVTPNFEPIVPPQTEAEPPPPQEPQPPPEDAPRKEGEWYYANLKPKSCCTCVLVVVAIVCCPILGLLACVLFIAAKCQDRSKEEKDPKLKRAEDCNVKSKDCAIASIILGFVILTLIGLTVLFYYTSVIPTYSLGI